MGYKESLAEAVKRLGMHREVVRQFVTQGNVMATRAWQSERAPWVLIERLESVLVGTKRFLYVAEDTEGNRWIPYQEYAQERGLNPDAVRRSCANGTIDALVRRVNQLWVIRVAKPEPDQTFYDEVCKECALREPVCNTPEAAEGCPPSVDHRPCGEPECGEGKLCAPDRCPE